MAIPSIQLFFSFLAYKFEIRDPDSDSKIILFMYPKVKLIVSRSEALFLTMHLNFSLLLSGCFIVGVFLTPENGYRTVSLLEDDIEMSPRRIWYKFV